MYIIILFIHIFYDIFQDSEAEIPILVRPARSADVGSPRNRQTSDEASEGEAGEVPEENPSVWLQ